MHDEVIKEMRDRLRRVETRLTKFLESQGFDTGTRRPLWDRGIITIPSPSCSFRDAIAVVPPDWNTEEEITIMHQGSVVAYIYMP